MSKYVKNDIECLYPFVSCVILVSWWQHKGMRQSFDVMVEMFPSWIE